MNTQKQHLVTSILMLGVLSMIFAALAFAEKTQEDVHLPERDAQGSGELTAFAVATGFSAVLAPVFPASAGRAGSRRGLSAISSLPGMRCPSAPSFFTGTY